jgi:uncharacterized protein YdaU (DUF1376 family)
MDEAIDWTWASSKEEIEAVEFVLRKFFTLDGGVYVQQRIKDEIAEYHAKAETNKRIAMEREMNRAKSKTGRARVVDKSSPPKDEPPPNQEPLTNNQEPQVKDSCSEPQSDSEPAVIALPLVDKTDFLVTTQQLEEWSAAYPGVDVLQQLRSMRQWCMANQAQRKTRRGICAFVVRWLAKEQDRGRPAVSQPREGKYTAAARTIFGPPQTMEDFIDV